jgi:hypothetical protein
MHMASAHTTQATSKGATGASADAMWCMHYAATCIELLLFPAGLFGDNLRLPEQGYNGRTLRLVDAMLQSTAFQPF